MVKIEATLLTVVQMSEWLVTHSSSWNCFFQSFLGILLAQHHHHVMAFNLFCCSKTIETSIISDRHATNSELFTNLSG
jgi:hypothetical protein